jgi:hypothetical protein
MYRGWAIPGAREYQIGQQVLVYFDPLDPNKSASLTNSEIASLNGARLTVGLSLVPFRPLKIANPARKRENSQIFSHWRQSVGLYGGRSRIRRANTV